MILNTNCSNASVSTKQLQYSTVGTEKGAASGDNRVKRGGSWNNDADNAARAYRNNNDPDNRNNNLGFRLGWCP